MNPLNETPPAGALWMCGACGRTCKDRRIDIGDESCYMHAKLVKEDSVRYDKQGRAYFAIGYTKDENA